MSDKPADERGDAREPTRWDDTAMARIEKEMKVEVSSRAASPHRWPLGSISARRRKEERGRAGDQAASRGRRRILGSISAGRTHTAKEVESEE
jgi:hypothetical protein